jgi:hypothetical protein
MKVIYIFETGKRHCVLDENPDGGQCRHANLRGGGWCCNLFEMWLEIDNVVTEKRTLRCPQCLALPEAPR